MLLSESFCNLLRKSVSSLLDFFVPIEHHHKRYAEAERV